MILDTNAIPEAPRQKAITDGLHFPCGYGTGGAGGCADGGSALPAPGLRYIRRPIFPAFDTVAPPEAGD